MSKPRSRRPRSSIRGSSLWPRVRSRAVSSPGPSPATATAKNGARRAGRTPSRLSRAPSRRPSTRNLALARAGQIVAPEVAVAVVESLGENLDGLDAIDPERAESLAQLAPGA